MNRRNDPDQKVESTIAGETGEALFAPDRCCFRFDDRDGTGIASQFRLSLGQRTDGERQCVSMQLPSYFSSA